MRLHAVLLAAGLALVPVASAVSQEPQTPIQPGYWESRSKIGIGPVTLSNKVERKCLTPKDVDEFISGPSNRHYACTYPTRSVADGKIILGGQCVHRKKGTRIALNLSGDYKETSFDMKATLKWGLLTGSGSINAHRIGDECPAGSEIK